MDYHEYSKEELIRFCEKLQTAMIAFGRQPTIHPIVIITRWDQLVPLPVNNEWTQFVVVECLLKILSQPIAQIPVPWFMNHTVPVTTVWLHKKCGWHPFVGFCGRWNSHQASVVSTLCSEQIARNVQIAPHLLLWHPPTHWLHIPFPTRVNVHCFWMIFCLFFPQMVWNSHNHVHLLFAHCTWSPAFLEQVV